MTRGPGPDALAPGQANFGCHSSVCEWMGKNDDLLGIICFGLVFFGFAIYRIYLIAPIFIGVLRDTRSISFALRATFHREFRQELKGKKAIMKLPPQEDFSSYVEAGGKRSDDDDLSCVICMEYLKGADFCQVLPLCNHIFHSVCINLWLMKMQNCPVCRSIVDH